MRQIRNIPKRLAAIVCAAALTLALLPVQAQAAETAVYPVSETWGNPLYPSLAAERAGSGTALLSDGGMPSFDTASQAADYIAQQFKARENMAFFYTGYPADGPFLALTADEESAAYDSEEQELVSHGASRADILQRRQLMKYVGRLVTEELLPEVFRYDPGDPTGGDYMRTQYRDVTCSAAYDGGILGVSVTFTYFTTAAQEAETDKAAAELLDYLGLDGMTGYDRLTAIYDWICAHVAFDYAHQKDETYLAQYTAYGALVDKAAVGQGYAALLYRLALAAGLDARIVTGTARGAAHHWCLLRMGERWYYADAAWDAGSQARTYFLRPALTYHVPDDASLAMAARYPLADSAYLLTPGDVNGDGLVNIQDVQALYAYLTLERLPAGSGALSAADFRSAADVNNDGAADVYDLQRLYELVTGLG